MGAYMFSDIITQCENNILSMPCCHNDGRDYYCYSSLYAGFCNTPNEYDCDKKMNYYVLKYGSSYYVGEIYHYLENSLLIESLNITNINILSLGCGFCPDYYAVSQYITNKKLDINFQYYGLDISTAWNTTRLSYSNVHCDQSDLVQPFNIQNAHIIMLNKIFSTTYRHGLHDSFLSNLIEAINPTMMQNAVLIFNDVNSIYMGRDIFDKRISLLFSQSNMRKYYTDNPPYIGMGLMPIPQNTIICPMTALPSIEPISFINRNIFFEYRK
jgi:hypothetical protein